MLVNDYTAFVKRFLQQCLIDVTCQLPNDDTYKVRDIQPRIKLHFQDKTFRFLPELLVINNTLALDFQRNDTDLNTVALKLHNLRLKEQDANNTNSQPLTPTQSEVEYDLLYMALVKQLVLMTHKPLLNQFYEQNLFDANNLSDTLVKLDQDATDRIKALSSNQQIPITEAKKSYRLYRLGLDGQPF